MFEAASGALNAEAIFILFTVLLFSETKLLYFAGHLLRLFILFDQVFDMPQIGLMNVSLGVEVNLKWTLRWLRCLTLEHLLQT